MEVRKRREYLDVVGWESSVLAVESSEPPATVVDFADIDLVADDQRELVFSTLLEGVQDAHFLGHLILFHFLCQQQEQVQEGRKGMEVFCFAFVQLLFSLLVVYREEGEKDAHVC